MRIQVNGESTELADASTVADLATQLGARDRGSAVAVGGQVVPRTRWPETTLVEGSVVEVLTAVQGG